jgi:putative membrane protein
MKFISSAAVLLAMLIMMMTGGIAFAQQRQASQQDRMFLTQNAQTDMAEIMSGGLAAQKGTTEAIRSTGRHLMQDHQQALNQVRSLARAKNIRLPNTPNPSQQQEAQQLRSASGSAFDRVYVQREIQGHQKSISQTQQELGSGSDPQIKQFARHYLPVAQEHLRRLQADQQQLPRPRR